MSKEIIDLLEKMVKDAENIQGYAHRHSEAIIDARECFAIQIQLRGDQALTLFKQQSTAGEFTKAFRQFLTICSAHNITNKAKFDLVKRSLEACDRLDRAEAINKELLELCEEFMEIADDGSARFDDPEPGSIYLRAETLIARAKKER